MSSCSTTYNSALGIFFLDNLFITRSVSLGAKPMLSHWRTLIVSRDFHYRGGLILLFEARGAMV